MYLWSTRRCRRFSSCCSRRRRSLPISQIIEDASFRIQNPERLELQSLAADFVAVANDSCGISLSQQQIINVTGLFFVLLPEFFFVSRECDLLNQTLVESAVETALESALADAADSRTALALEISFANPPSRAVFLANRIITGANSVLFSPTVDAATAAAQTALDEFLFNMNVLCAIPPLSNVTLAQLDEYFEVAVNFATGQA